VINPLFVLPIDDEPTAEKRNGSAILLPIQHVCEAGSLSKTGPHVLVASLSHFDP